MNRSEAYEQAKKGLDITHQRFVVGEYLYFDKQDNKIKTEDGFDFSDLFWNKDYFASGWSVCKTNSAKKSDPDAAWKHIIRRINSYTEENNITYVQIALKSGYTRQEVSNFLKSKHCPSLKKFLKIVEAVGLEINLSFPD